MTKAKNVFSLPAITIQKDFLFPQVRRMFTIRKKISVATLNYLAGSGNKQLVLLFQKNENPNPSLEDFYNSGLLVEVTQIITNIEPLDSEEVSCITEMVGANFVNIDNVRLKEFLNPANEQLEDFTECDFTIKDPIRIEHNQEVLSYIHLIKEISKKYAEISYLKDGMAQDILAADNNAFIAICYHLVSLVLKNNKDLIPFGLNIIDTNSALDVLKLSYDILSKELVSFEMRQEIVQKVKEETYNLNKEMVLRQQMKFIQEELNEGVDDFSLLEERLKNIVPENIFNNVVVRELKKLNRISPLNAEHQVVRNYLEFLSELPWKEETVDNYNLKNAQEILDKDHYGLSKIKERIIEFIAVKAHSPLAKSPILCFVGPPGVGKTSLGQSIARALDRNFQRIALGGLHDEAELRGHRRTYIGAMPGKIIETLRRSGSNNPVILLDEVDKISNSYKGDPSGALLEILDPEQNKNFKDNYLDVPYDLSNVLFICTANSIDTISPPLLDRMELIQLSSYTETEKVFIALNHLIPKQLEAIALSEKYVKFSEAALRHIIFNYAPEAGVRKLEELIAKIIRKILVKLSEVKFNEKLIKKNKLNEITTQNLNKFLGVERPFDLNKREELKIGNGVGLAWSRVGGSVLYIESLITGSNKELLITGSIGDSMSESTKIALSYLRSNAKTYRLDTSLTNNASLHVHFPEGAVKKDGPSAGIAIVTALYSLFSENIMRKDIAMTGEVTLSGLVLPIGGLKEKAIAAMRAGFKKVIIPKANEADLIEFPDELKENIKFIPVENVDQVLYECFDNFIVLGANSRLSPYMNTLTITNNLHN